MRALLTTAALIGATVSLSASAQAVCIPNPIPANWLQTQEAPNVAAAPPPHGGHTIALHIGQTDQQLQQRLQNNPNIPAAGSFPASAPPAANYAAAQATITANIAGNTNAINNWANAAANGARQAYNYQTLAVVGRVATRNPNVVNNTNNFRIVFQALGGGNCFVLTSFPTP
jgi:hypothetical protein